MKKQHWILRTHAGVPVPPEGAVGYSLSFRDGSCYSETGTNLSVWYWSTGGGHGDILAIRWIFNEEELYA